MSLPRREKMIPNRIKSKATVRDHIKQSLFVFLLIVPLGCGGPHQSLKADGAFTLQPNMKIKVADVSNATGGISDVDVIGLFWDALNVALSKQDLLYSKDSSTVPLQLHAYVTEYKKGSAWERWLLPGMGSTVLAVKCDLKDGDRVLTTIEARRRVSTGDGLTIGAWRQIYLDIAEDVVHQLQPIS